MPTVNSALSNPDPIIMTPDDVNDTIINYLQNNGFFIERGLSNSEVDIRAEKKDFVLIIESRGNQGYKNKGTENVFDGSQLDIHLSEHVTQLMRFQQSVSTNRTPIFIMGNPDIPRIKNRVAKISEGLNKLQIVRFWVNNPEEINMDGPENLKELLNKLV